MKWQDMIIQRPLTDQEIRTSMAAAFGIPPAEVAVQRTTDDYPKPDGMKVACVASERDGGFRLYLCVYAYFDASHLDDLSVVKEFARAAQTELLISDESPNPYTMLRVLPTGEILPTKLDVLPLDEREEYHISE